jgi:hypothetical protein
MGEHWLASFVVLALTEPGAGGAGTAGQT